LASWQGFPAAIFHLLKLATDEGWFIAAEKDRDDEKGYAQVEITG